MQVMASLGLFTYTHTLSPTHKLTHSLRKRLPRAAEARAVTSPCKFHL